MGVSDAQMHKSITIKYLTRLTNIYIFENIREKTQEPKALMILFKLLEVWLLSIISFEKYGIP